MISNLVNFILFLPTVVGLFLFFLPKTYKRHSRYIAAVSSFVHLLMAVALILEFDPNMSGLQFSEKHLWMSALKAEYHLGVDGLNILLVFSTVLLFHLSILLSTLERSYSQSFYSIFLFLESSILGIFLAQDLFLLFSFWMLSAFPVFLITGIWNTVKDAKQNSSLHFIIYQLLSAVLLCLSIFLMYFHLDAPTFDIESVNTATFSAISFDLYLFSISLDQVIFILLLLCIFLRLPVFPFYSWFEEIQEKALVPLGMILSSIFTLTAGYLLLKLNAYLFPKALHLFSPFLAALGLVQVIFSSFSILVQTDLKKLMRRLLLFCYGLMLIGIGSEGPSALQGSLFLMITVCFGAALLHYLIEQIGVRVGSFEIKTIAESSEMPLSLRLPSFTAFFTIALFSILSIPFFGSYLAQQMIWINYFQIHTVQSVFYAISYLICLSGVLYFFLKMFFKKNRRRQSLIHAADLREDFSLAHKLCLLPFLGLCIYLGTFPAALLRLTQTSIQVLVEGLK